MDVRFPPPTVPPKHPGDVVRAGVGPPGHLTGDEAVAWIAARQHGVVSRAQLAACGLSRTAIAHRVRRGRLHPLLRGVYAVGRAEVSPEGRVLAAVLAVGVGAVASHHSAGRLLRILPAGSSPTIGLGPVDVAVCGGRRPRDRPEVRCHEMRVLDGRDLRWVGPIPVTSAARTVLDVAGSDGPRTAERMLAEALRANRATEAEVRSLVTRAHGHHGCGIVAELIRAGPAFDRSVAERLLLELVRRSGLPEPRTNHAVAGYEVDACWEERAVVAEFDSFTFHGDVLAFRRDRRKWAALQAAGYDVVPVIWSDLCETPEVVVATLASVLAIATVRR